MVKSHWLLGLAGLVLLIVVAVFGRWLNSRGENGCALDGGKIEPLYQVRIEDHSGKSRQFCCLRCAELWLEQQPTPQSSIWVTDEATGREIAASQAFFVRSAIITTPTTGNRIHVFQQQADAENHARLGRGKVLQGEERPLQRQN